MPQNVTQYSLLISCPGDIDNEIDLINKAVEEFNNSYTDTIGISIRTKYWKKNSYAESGDKPQNLLNKQFVEDCDAAVALLWTRFGTPTDKYGSGTEEEIELMLSVGKQVFMYFSDKPISPSVAMKNAEEYTKVTEFREKYKDRGIYYSYSSDEEFAKLIFAHLSRCFLSVSVLEEERNIRKPNLMIRGIGADEKICQELSVHKFKLHTDRSDTEYRNDIINLYCRISGLHVGKRIDLENSSNGALASIGQMFSAFRKPVEIDEDIKECLTELKTVFGVEMSDDFFDLGNLTRDPMQTSLLNSSNNLEGTAEEKSKYNLIIKLYNTLNECSRWMPIERTFSDINCIELAIENNGTAIDEDIEVSIEFEKALFMDFSDLKQLDNNSMKYIVNECGVSTLLRIQGTSQYKEYESSLKPQFKINSISSSDLSGFPFGSAKDYQKEFEADYDEALGFEIYFEKEKVILKYKFDYIKHNTIVAFPAPIFLKGDLRRITYKICSRHAAKITEGELEL